MPQRRSVGRRFVDLQRDAPLPPYPVELERRRRARREEDRAPFDVSRPRKRAPLLFCARWNCAFCGRELRRQPNVPPGTRRFTLVEAPRLWPCDCHEARLAGEAPVLSWKFQAGEE